MDMHSHLLSPFNAAHPYVCFRADHSGLDRSPIWSASLEKADSPSLQLLPAAPQPGAGP